jgi:heme exporter protein C
VKALKWLLGPYLLAVILAAFFWPQPAKGFIGESSRIVFFHVPMAWAATIAFVVAAIY